MQTGEQKTVAQESLTDEIIPGWLKKQIPLLRAYQIDNTLMHNAY
jgi:hypothetical protein